MSAVTGSYGIYSKKQFENILSQKENDKRDFPYIYYKDINDNIVQITEVVKSSQDKSNFDDAIYLGELKSFHGVSLQPINYPSDIKE